MRKDNQPDLTLNRATLTLSAHNYDRRALDTNSALPLTHTCIQLASQLRASPALCTTLALHDGGLDRLLHLVESTRPTDAKLALLWITAYNALATLVCHGSDACRVEAAKKGVLRIALVVVSNYVRQLEANTNTAASTTSMPNVPTGTAAAAAAGAMPVAVGAQPVVVALGSTVSPSTTPFTSSPIAAQVVASTPIAPSPMADTLTQENATVGDVHQDVHQAVDPMLAASGSPTASSMRRRVSLSASPSPADSQAHVEPHLQSQQLPSTTTAFHLSRHQDMLLTLQILAAMIHLPAVRAFLRQPQPQQPAASDPCPSSSPSIPTWCGMSLLEPLTRSQAVPATLRSLAIHLLAQATVLSMPAGVALAKDAKIVPGSCCSNLACRQVESSAKPFSRCSKCKCARYCSRDCQVTAWASGHRYWCDAAGVKASHVAKAQQQQLQQASASGKGPYVRPSSQQAAMPESTAAKAGSDRVARMRAAAQQAAAAAASQTTHSLTSFHMAPHQSQT